MSEPSYETATEIGAGGMIDPIHVVIDGKTEPPEQSPEFGSWQTIQWPASTSVAASFQQLLPQADKRYEAQIQVTPQPVTTTPAVNAIALPASATPAYNNNSVGVNVTVAGGTVSAIAINGTTTGATSGTFFVPAGGTITVTYTVAPTTFTTAGIPVTAISPTAFVRIGSMAQVQNGAGAQVFAGRIPYHASGPLWVASDGVNPVVVVILDERYL